MTTAKTLGPALLAAALALTGCDKKAEPSKAEPRKGGHETHAHGKGPHGGVIFDLGKVHGEFDVDHDKKEAVLYILGGDEKTAKAVDAKEMTVTTKETKTKEGKVVPPITVKLLPKDLKDGKATTFAGTDPGLGNVAEFEGTVTAEIDGKPAEGEFKE